MENFFRSCFETSKNTNDFHYTSLKKKNPDKTEDEIFELFKEEIVGLYDFEREDCRIFMMDGENGEFVGYIWVAIRDSEDSWDFEKLLFIVAEDWAKKKDFSRFYMLRRIFLSKRAVSWDL